MSMLAEKRTKKKWCLNPNGKEWSNDNNKFGQRMLEKMGWKKGCGLGANLQGMKEHVRVSAKNDTKGLGCKNNNDGEWIQQQQNFENLLSELASTAFEETRPHGPTETQPVSLEEKSKKSRVRVHYQKFTRGKDVSQYSAKDLACIFGKKNNSLENKSSEISNSCHTNTRNTSQADSESDMISDEHGVRQSFVSCEGETIDVEVLPEYSPSVIHKRRKKDHPKHDRHAKDMQENQNDILKEISNVNEISFPDVEVIQELKNEMEDDSANHISSKSVKKIKIKTKRKQNTENSQEIFIETTISTSQEEVNENVVLADEVQEVYTIEREKKNRKKKKKDKEDKAEVEVQDNEKKDNEIYGTQIEVKSDGKEPGYKELVCTSVISESETADFKIKRKKMHKVLFDSNLFEEQKQEEETKKKKKKKVRSIHPVIDLDPPPRGNSTAENDPQNSMCFNNEAFSSDKGQPRQCCTNSAVKHRKKRHRQNREVYFRGSNLDSIPGYGNL